MLLLLLACPAPPDTGDTDPVEPIDTACDPAVDGVDIWPDEDGDGYGAPGNAIKDCSVPEGYAGATGDCEDDDPAVHPGAEEVCNGIDDDCDDRKDDVEAAWYEDADSDGYGNAATGLVTCTPDAGWVLDGTDCDDTVATTHPGAEEACNATDDDCDGVSDLGYEDTWYSDDDGDGYGNPNVSEYTCLPSEGWVQDGSDCRAGDPLAFPGASEQCNDADDDCDGGVDEDFDLDGDGHTSNLCVDGDDCDDDDATIFGGAAETCEDGIDQSCDGYDPRCTYDGSHDLGDYEKIYSDEPNFDAGRLVVVGDPTGDGEPDIVVTTFYANGYQGGGYVIPGPFGSTEALGDRGYFLSGGMGTSYAGRSLGVGDVDGDGIDDVGLGAPDGTEKEFIILGPVSADVSLDDADIIISSPTAIETGHGGDLADVTGDGVADAVIGAYEDSTGGYASGTVFIHAGPLSAGDFDLDDDADLRIVGDAAMAYAGRYLRAGPDANGDGIGDMLLAAPYQTSAAPYAGSVYLVYGGLSGDIDTSDADGTFTGVAASDYAGEDLAMGDLDGDGLADVIVGSYGNSAGSYAGTAYVEYGPASGTTDLAAADVVIEGDYANQQFGLGFGVGDTDSDGAEELLVGAIGDRSGGNSSGATYLFYAPITATAASDADAWWEGEAAGDQAGEGADIADLDGDGFAELLIGAPGESTGGASGGAVYVVTPDN